MFIVRPITEEDLDDLERFAYATEFGLLSLPKDRALLLKKIRRSIQSFKKKVTSPKQELYLFVLVDTTKNASFGSSAIMAKPVPLLIFRKETLPKIKMQILKPSLETDEASELCSLFLEHSCRKEHLGELISRSRFLFIAEHLQRFCPNVVARLRGFHHLTKRSCPFWEGVGKQFFNLTFQQAQEKLQRNSGFVADFLPKYPIYISLLPKNVQSVIQKTHSSTKVALKMLKQEGFKLTNQVDIFDGGPTVVCKTENIYTVKSSTKATISEIHSNLESKLYIIANTSLDFLATMGRLTIKGDNSICVDTAVAKAINLSIGDTARFIVASSEL